MGCAVISDRRGREEVGSVDGECLGSGSGYGRGGREAGDSWNGVGSSDGEVDRVRRAAAGRRVGDDDRIASCRGLVGGAEGDGQLRGVDEGGGVGGAVISDRGGGEEVGSLDGE